MHSNATQRDTKAGEATGNYCDVWGIHARKQESLEAAQYEQKILKILVLSMRLLKGSFPTTYQFPPMSIDEHADFYKRVHLT